MMFTGDVAWNAVEQQLRFGVGTTIILFIPSLLD